MGKELVEEIERLCNRHTARLMGNLEDAHCPDVYKQAAKTELQWLRSDLKELAEMKEPHEIKP